MDGGFQIGGRRVLHAGCGRDRLPEWFVDCQETRLDIDPACDPDVVAPMHELGNLGPFDVVCCKHALEHLPRHEAQQTLSEFHRVLAVNGFLFLVVPDLEGVMPTDEVLFVAPCGPITGHDLIYGHHAAAENPYMHHKTGFTRDTLEACLRTAGFSWLDVRRTSGCNLLAITVKT